MNEVAARCLTSTSDRDNDGDGGNDSGAVPSSSSKYKCSNKGINNKKEASEEVLSRGECKQDDFTHAHWYLESRRAVSPVVLLFFNWRLYSFACQLLPVITELLVLLCIIIIIVVVAHHHFLIPKYCVWCMSHMAYTLATRSTRHWRQSLWVLVVSRVCIKYSFYIYARGLRDFTMFFLCVRDMSEWWSNVLAGLIAYSFTYCFRRAVLVLQSFALSQLASA